MSVLDNPAERAAWAKKLAKESAPKGERDARDTLSGWDRDMFFGGKAVQLRIPLLDPVMVRTHLAMVEAAVRDLRLHLEQVKETDRSALLTVHGAVRTLNQKLNAYKTPRR